nr:hypothetical protein [Moritella viscosa]
MTKLIYNENYSFEEMPEDYDYDVCHNCGHDVWFEEENIESLEDDPFYIRTCEKCDAMRELSFNHNLIYFYGEDYKEVQFYNRKT